MLLVAAVAPSWKLAGAYAAAYLILRLSVAWVVAVRVIGDAVVRRRLWLVPVRDALNLCVYFASFFTNRVHWRGQTYRVHGASLIPIGVEGTLGNTLPSSDDSNFFHRADRGAGDCVGAARVLRGGHDRRAPLFSTRTKPQAGWIYASREHPEAGPRRRFRDLREFCEFLHAGICGVRNSILRERSGRPRSGRDRADYQ